MNAVVIVRVAADGKAYPRDWVLPERDRNRVINLSHIYVHRDRLSIRAAQKQMLERFGLRRSVGSICHDLRAYVCPVCGPVVTNE